MPKIGSSGSNEKLAMFRYSANKNELKDIADKLDDAILKIATLAGTGIGLANSTNRTHMIPGLEREAQGIIKSIRLARETVLAMRDEAVKLDEAGLHNAAVDLLEAKARFYTELAAKKRAGRGK